MITRRFLILLLMAVVHAKVDIRQTTANKAFMETMVGGSYEVVHPFQIREKNERIGIDTRNYFLKAQEHYAHVTIVIRSNVIGRLKLVLERNNFVFLNQTAFHKLDSEGERVISNRVENCYYQGTVGGEDGSFVALSSCNGLRGVISFVNGTTYGVWPLDGSDRNSRRHPHILYKSTWSQEAKCGASLAHAAHQKIKREAFPSHVSSLISPRPHHRRRRHRKRDVSKRTKYVEVALIADYEFMKYRGLVEMDAVSYMLEAINIADFMLSRDLNIRLSAVYVELWTDAQRIDLHDDIERTLSGVVDYTAGHIYHIQKDATILFTGGTFANSEVGNSAIRSVCTARSAIIVKALDPFGTQWSAEIVAQSTGHLLGLEHDTTACSCEPAPECVMRAHPGKKESPFAWQFSKCSVARMHGIWQDGNVQCLLNRPFQTSELRECGNGIVDGTEECDCGGRETCDDPCCDPLTCTLRAHAQCAAHHKCCHRCELKKKGEVCRTSRSPCDVAEQCDGQSGDCPADGHLIDGTVCGNDGHCWRGNCSDARSQCDALWGSDARVAEGVCFDQNSKGMEYANCGQQSDGTYHPCKVEDVQCGTLHCQGGSIAPTDSSLKAFTFHFQQNSQQVQCKSIASSSFGLTADGTNCGSGRVCVAGSCVEMSSVTAAVSCPTNNLALLCSGHGHCTTTAKCVCFNGWSGAACDMRSNSSTYSGGMGFEHTSETRLKTLLKERTTLVIPHIGIGATFETATLLAILLAVGVLLLFCLVCLLFCYRRKSIVEIPTPCDEKADDDLPERAIKFGNMPSYREEKRKRKSTKRIYGALNRITEADERDSTSLRSRESNGSQMLLDPRTGAPRGDPFASEHIYAESAGFSSRAFSDTGGYPLRSFGSWRSSPAPMSPTSSTGHGASASTSHVSTTPLRLNKIGQILRNMQSDDEASSPLYNDAAVMRGDQFGGLGEDEMMHVVDDHDAASNTESSRCGDDGRRTDNSWSPPSFSNNQTSSAASSHRGTNSPHNNFEFRQSPSLFSDPFKLEMTNSVHS